jgi:hypothetical protein
MYWGGGDNYPDSYGAWIFILPRDTNSRGIEVVVTQCCCSVRADGQEPCLETRSVHSLRPALTIKLIAPHDPWNVFLESVCEKFSRLAGCNVLSAARERSMTC